MSQVGHGCCHESDSKSGGANSKGKSRGSYKRIAPGQRHGNLPNTNEYTSGQRDRAACAIVRQVTTHLCLGVLGFTGVVAAANAARGCMGAWNESDALRGMIGPPIVPSPPSHFPAPPPAQFRPSPPHVVLPQHEQGGASPPKHLVAAPPPIPVLLPLSPPSTPNHPVSAPPAHLSPWTRAQVVAQLNSRFSRGSPSNSLAEAGVLVRQFESETANDAPWNACTMPWCMAFSDRLATSVINQQAKNLYYGTTSLGGFVIAPTVEIYCACK